MHKRPGRSDLRPTERVDLLTDTACVRQAALLLPERERVLERPACVVDPARALEHGGEVFVAPRLKDQAVRLGLREGDASARKSLRLLELVALGEEERLHGGSPSPLDRARRDGLGLA
jgi:hypothetical protein